MGENDLIMAMSNEDLQAFKAKYTDNASVQTLIDGILTTRKAEELQAKAKAEFVKQIEKLSAKLPHPEDIHNVYLAWREVEEFDTTKDMVDVQVVIMPSVMGEGSKVATPAIMGVEKRYPMHKVTRWQVEVNKGFQPASGKSDSTGKVVTATKRAITVKRINGNALTFIGNFPSCAEACKYLGIVVGTQNARIPLRAAGYIDEPYIGTDFTS